jgi:DNA mismatch repair protein MutS
VSGAETDRLTPARRQYLEIKAQCPPDALLLYRMGDFYETFDDDAYRAAEALHITLTSREFGRGVRVPLAGIPAHSLNSYLARLLAKGFKVAICEQLSEPGRGIIDRGVVRIVTPGTVAEPELLRASENSYLAAVCARNESVALAYVDVSTGEFHATHFEGPEAAAQLATELARLQPAETLAPPGSGLPHAGALTILDEREFDPEAAAARLRQTLNVVTLAAFGCADLPAVTAAAGAIVSYLQRTNPRLLNLLTGLSTYTTARYLALDPATRAHLELLRGGRGDRGRGGLLALLDQTKTAMGGRLLRRWLSQPLLDLAAIEERLDAVAALVGDAARRRRLIAAIARVADLERLAGRIAQGSATPRECRLLAASLRLVPGIKAALEPLPALAAVAAALDPLDDVASLIERAIAEDGGGLIRRGFDAEIDRLLDAADRAQQTLLRLEQRERERTGIRSLKVGYTRVYGYYLEVTRPNLPLVPKDYHHKQTLANAERFVTQELRDCEDAIAAAQEQVAELEQRLYADVLRRIAAENARLQAVARALAQLDVYLALAEVATTHGWTRPRLDDSCSLDIADGRHPVVESRLPPGEFVANDCTLDPDGCQIALVTGPNMAGKSTYLRQVALCVVLAQMGSFVPARAARIGIVDRIFTRIGAQDDIAAGASTFMVEMIETATILRHATRRSLVLLDEVGRGTSTRDGRAIARAVLEYLHHHVGARTLFATHFHELAGLAESLPRLRAFNVSAIEDAGRLVFLHRLQPGACDRSYGVQVARLAGVPPAVIARAEQLLRQQDDTETPRDLPDGAARLLAELAALDVLRMPPLEAQARLHELRERARALGFGEGEPSLLALLAGSTA